MKSISVILSFLITSACLADNWPTWQGSDRTNLSKETGLLKKWPADGPTAAWISDVAGLGYAGPAVVDDRLYTMGAFGDKEYLIALDVSSGKLLWKTEMGPLLTNGWGDGPRSTPSYSNGGVYAMSGTGVLVCCNAATGKKVWDKKMADFNAQRHQAPRFDIYGNLKDIPKKPGQEDNNILKSLPKMPEWWSKPGEMLG